MTTDVIEVPLTAAEKRLLSEGNEIKKKDSATQWAWGDWVNKVEPGAVQGQGVSGRYARLGKLVNHLDVETSIHTFIEDGRIAALWPVEHRQEGTSWWVHRILSVLDNRFEVIKQVPKGGWSVDKARAYVKELKATQHPSVRPAPGKKHPKGTADSKGSAGKARTTPDAKPPAKGQSDSAAAAQDEAADETPAVQATLIVSDALKGADRAKDALDDITRCLRRGDILNDDQSNRIIRRLDQLAQQIDLIRDLARGYSPSTEAEQYLRSLS